MQCTFNHHCETTAFLQVIYQGKTAQSLPPLEKRSGVKFKGWHWTQSENHWSNLDAMKALVINIIEPYRLRKCEELGLPTTSFLLWLIDCWSVHISKEFRKWLKDRYKYLLVIYVSPNCTPKGQPQDAGTQKPFKTGVHRSFRSWQAGRYTRCIQAGANGCFTLMLHAARLRCSSDVGLKLHFVAHFLYMQLTVQGRIHLGLTTSSAP